MAIRKRTIAVTEERSRQIRLAAAILGVSGEAFIQDAITEHLRVTFGRTAAKTFSYADDR